MAVCADKGFAEDASESEKLYSVQNSDGYQLSVSYQGNGVMFISVDEPEYAVSLEIECVENLLLSKYDVDVYVDDSMQGTISHGTAETYSLNLTKGVYEIKFVSAEDDEVAGGVSIDIHQDESLKYKISCTSSQINVENIQGTVSEHGEDDPNRPVDGETPNSTTESATELAENLTVENCSDLAALLALRDPGDPSVSTFASKYYGQIIEFDGCVMNMQHHGDFDTRWDVFVFGDCEIHKAGQACICTGDENKGYPKRSVPLALGFQ